MTALKFKRVKLPITGATVYEAELPGKKLRITRDYDGWNLRICRGDEIVYKVHRFINEYDTKAEVVQRINEMLNDNEAWNI